MPVLALPVGNDHIEVNTEHISVGKSKVLHQAIAELKKKHTWLSKVPLRENETIDDWQARVFDELGKSEEVKNKRREGEDNEAYLSRVLAAETDDLALYFDCLKLIARLFDREDKLNEELFETIPVEQMVRFIRDVFGKARLNVEEVFPKRF